VNLAIFEDALDTGIAERRSAQCLRASSRIVANPYWVGVQDLGLASPRVARGSFRRAAATPFNLVFEARAWRIEHPGAGNSNRLNGYK
jgi:hypothetical protein